MTAGPTAFVSLTGALIRRLLREGLVLRSLVFPVALTVGTLVVTLAIIAAVRPLKVVAVPDDLDPVLVTEIEAAGFTTLASPDPPTWVERRWAWAGTDGHTIWRSWPRPDDLVLEAVLRRHHDAWWTPDSHVQLPEADSAGRTGLLVVRIIGALFTLYGVVFGCGMVARDRDDGTLEAEYALPVPWWVHGLTRWVAGSLLLTVFFGLATLLFAALYSLPDTGATLLHGASASMGSVAIGLLVVGRAGLQSGFSSVLSTGLLSATILLGLGWALPEVGQWVPISSLTTDGSGWPPLALAVLFGLFSAFVFSRRAAV